MLVFALKRAHPARYLYRGQYHVQQTLFLLALDRSLAWQHYSNAPGLFPMRRSCRGYTTQDENSRFQKRFVALVALVSDTAGEFALSDVG
ncbi:MAG TPA: hypothetical protein VJQ26_07400 [Ktedonobacteraceae bacterium]|nr:hypothetical protein [Ktedonobacteraceae bacterium]